MLLLFKQSCPERPVKRSKLLLQSDSDSEKENLAANTNSPNFVVLGPSKHKTAPLSSTTSASSLAFDEVQQYMSCSFCFTEHTIHYTFEKNIQTSDKDYQLSPEAYLQFQHSEQSQKKF